MPTPRPTGSAPGFSIAMILLAVSLFALSDVAAKQLTAQLPPEQVVWLRFIPQLFIALWLVVQRRRRLLPTTPGAQIIRGVALLGAGAFFILGLRSLGLAEATAISFVTPAFITLLAILFLGETVGLHRWIALGLGLAGVLLVVRPGTAAFQPAALLPAASAFCGAVMAVITRRIAGRDSSETTLLWSAAVGFALLSLSAPWWWSTIDSGLLGPSLVMGLLYGAGQYLLILAYSRGDTSLVAPFAYVQVIVATALGALVFGHLPDTISLCGIGLIVMAGAYTLHREGIFVALRHPMR